MTGVGAAAAAAARVPCPRCGLETEAGRLDKHLRDELHYLPYKCALCRIRFYTLADAQAHFSVFGRAHPAQPPDIIEELDVRLEETIFRALQQAHVLPAPFPPTATTAHPQPPPPPPPAFMQAPLMTPARAQDPPPPPPPPASGTDDALFSVPKAEFQAPRPPSPAPPRSAFMVAKEEAVAVGAGAEEEESVDLADKSISEEEEEPESDEGEAKRPREADKDGSAKAGPWCLQCSAPAGRERMSHVVRHHFAQPTFACKLCPAKKKEWYVFSMASHVQIVHKLSKAAAAEAISDLREGHKAELLKAARKCFGDAYRPACEGWPNKDASLSGPRDSTPEPPAAKEAAMGVDIVNTTVAESPPPKAPEPAPLSSATVLRCALCQKETQRKFAAFHVKVHHLARNLFVCRADPCAKDFSTLRLAKKHEAESHGGRSTVESRAGEAETMAEIRGLLASCFGISELPEHSSDQPPAIPPAKVPRREEARDATAEPAGDGEVSTPCSKCGPKSQMATADPETRITHLLRHHLKRPRAKCARCPFVDYNWNLRNLRKHVGQEHAGTFRLDDAAAVSDLKDAVQPHVSRLHPVLFGRPAKIQTTRASL